MTTQVDFTRGGYTGDIVEDVFAPITKASTPFWWHFREVLRANHKASPDLKRMDGTIPSDDEQREFVALSLLNYAVYTSLAEAMTFDHELQSCLVKPGSLTRLFEARKAWKAFYSSLYSSLNALANIVCVLVGHDTPLRKKKFKDGNERYWNFTPTEAYNLVNGRGLTALADPFKRCQQRLEIREHLDHYWTIWVNIGYGHFSRDENFTKAYVPIRDSEIKTTVDAVKEAHECLANCLQDFNLIYEQLAVTGGYLDQYLQYRGWYLNYSDLGPPHDGKRPLP